MISFKVMGEPVGKGRPKFSRRGNYVHAYTPKATVEYEEKIKFEFLASNCESLPVYGKGIPLKLKLLIGMKIPKNFSQKKRELCYKRLLVPTKKPDVDNVLKCMDALNGLAFYDDSQITVVHAEKIYVDDPFLQIEIYPRDWQAE